MSPRVDGYLDEEIWFSANEARDFYQYIPYNDRPPSLPTIVKVLYDNKAIYIGAKLFDHYPDSILTQLGIRDADAQINADQFYIDINPFNDGVNGFTFKVSASGVQTDINRAGRGRRFFGGPSSTRGDPAWDAVWQSKVRILDDGWMVEIEIPYSALRFPKKDIQEWGINFWRDLRRHTELSSWNFVDREVRNQMNYLGVLKGINGVKPPLRLAFYPYVSGYLEKSASETGWTRTFNGGMDLKWGMNESYTMDVTLIPDFGQVKSDEKILNLTPYEVRYTERRQFFTEGTELFQRADLFYSRRIGSEPIRYWDIEDELESIEAIKENPATTRMINASKISGRNQKGLGIGFLNAMTAQSHAVVKDTINNVERSILTQPFTNYNILVVDQSLPNNSYVSLINTNTLMGDAGYNANVTGTEFRFYDKTNMYGMRGEFAYSQQNFQNNDYINGYKYDLRIGKFGGKLQYGLNRELVSDEYDQNDLGYQRRNNEIENQLTFDYNIFQPFGKFLSFGVGTNINVMQLYDPREFTELAVGLDSRATFVNRFNIFIRGEYSPLGKKDYYEPRVEGRYYKTDDAINIFSWLGSDRRRRLSFNGGFRYEKIFDEYEQRQFGIELMPRIRISDRMDFSFGLEYRERKNDIGYVDDSGPDSVFFGMRNSPTWITTLQSNYIFTNTISLGFDLRHYWSRVLYDGTYYFLNPDGSLTLLDNGFEADNINYNAFTIDMVFKWNFAPGSWLTAVWKYIVDAEGSLTNNYLDNVNYMFSETQVNSVSLKLLYYLDYQYIKSAFSKH
ncbi:DUF5916 domain-containing protein [Bacteroidota bacterium]